MFLDQFESAAKTEGYRIIAGVDEAGRGPLAGPVVASAVVFESKQIHEDLNDSKKLSPSKRERLYEYLNHTPFVHSAVGIVDSEEIDKINILQATFKAMHIAISGLNVLPDLVLIDGNQTIPFLKQIRQRAIIGGDALSYSIAAGSIIAKVVRDRIMDDYHKIYPEYGFDGHKGYGTKFHLEQLRKYGPSPIHRKSFSPVKNLSSSDKRQAHVQA